MTINNEETEVYNLSWNGTYIGSIGLYPDNSACFGICLSVYPEEIVRQIYEILKDRFEGQI